MRKTGVISSWRAAEGHGFITPSDGSFDVLFYKRDLATDEPVCAGLPVTYTLSAKKAASLKSPRQSRWSWRGEAPLPLPDSRQTKKLPAAGGPRPAAHRRQGREDDQKAFADRLEQGASTSSPLFAWRSEHRRAENVVQIELARLPGGCLF
jgi:cold shock CspA family protein